jgi:hypothetical protein
VLDQGRRDKEHRSAPGFLIPRLQRFGEWYTLVGCGPVELKSAYADRESLFRRWHVHTGEIRSMALFA